jgi:GGDEF domain-containing protein
MDASKRPVHARTVRRHLGRVAEASRARKRPLSVCVLRVRETEPVAWARQGGWLDRAMPQIGAMVSRLVRVEDTPARLAKEVFALALPATHAEPARLAAERIAAVIGCTAFDAGPDRSPFVAEFDVGAAEMRPTKAPPPCWNAPRPTCSKRRADRLYAPATRARSAVIRSATFNRSSAVGQSPETTIF